MSIFLFRFQKYRQIKVTKYTILYTYTYPENRVSKNLRPSKIYGAAKKVTIDVKWLVLDFTLLWQTMLKCVPRIATKKIIIMRIATGKSLHLRADRQGVIPVTKKVKRYTVF
jgi:hypothetical protein